jgi:hypothetical protein
MRRKSAPAWRYGPFKVVFDRSSDHWLAGTAADFQFPSVSSPGSSAFESPFCELAQAKAALRNLFAPSVSPESSAECARPYRNLALRVCPFWQFDESASRIGLQSRPTILSAASRIFAAPRLRFAFGGRAALPFIATTFGFTTSITSNFPGRPSDV